MVGRRSSRDALSAAVEFNPELAIVDIRMPDLDGFELMARLKTQFPDVDVILMTGSVDDLDEKLIRAIRSPLSISSRSRLTAKCSRRSSNDAWRLVAPDERQLRYVNAGHPPTIQWSGMRDPVWLGSTGPLVSPVLPTSKWEEQAVPIDEGDQLLLYTDGVSEVLADTDGCAEARITTTLQRNSVGGAQLLEAILADVRHDLAGRAQPDDLTLLTARVLAQPNVAGR